MKPGSDAFISKLKEEVYIQRKWQKKKPEKLDNMKSDIHSNHSTSASPVFHTLLPKLLQTDSYGVGKNSLEGSLWVCSCWRKPCWCYTIKQVAFLFLATDPVNMRSHQIYSCYVPYIQTIYSCPILLAIQNIPSQIIASLPQQFRAADTEQDRTGI